MEYSPSKQELENRINNLFDLLKKQDAFDTAMIINRVNQYYFTGTMQDGILIIKKNGDVAFFVRRSYERAKMECPLDIIYKMNSYKDILSFLPENTGCTYLETQTVTLSVMDRINKYFSFNCVKPLDRLIMLLREIKSPFEIEIIKESARQHEIILNKIVPGILREGMSETDFFAELYEKMIKTGYHGLSRFGMFQMEMLIGQMGFGENSVFPTNFDGPGGMLGMSPAMPIIGNRNSYLKKGDIVFVDIGYGTYGYHSDKTTVYSFKAKPSDEVALIHNSCMKIQANTAALMKPGANPGEIYNVIMKNIPDCLSEHFMGYTDPVRFLGHGVGLQIDETPVIASGFKEPLKENMVIALEPKCGIKGVGTVGVEETYIIGKNGAECITGGAKEILEV